jgi:RNA-directed DNA polymerase
MKVLGSDTLVRTVLMFMKIKWKQINWEQAEAYINRLQVRIVKAVKENKWRLVKRLQYLIMHSFYGKALAVKRVISNKGKNTPGIDGIVWKTDKDKGEATENL